LHQLIALNDIAITSEPNVCSLHPSFLVGDDHNNHFPVIHACARFPLRYELQHIVPWLFYHKEIGIGHFHLYFDPISSDLNHSTQRRKVYQSIVSLPFVTVYDTINLDMYPQWKSLKHCQTKAHQGHAVDWLIDFDIDEVIAVDPIVVAEPNDCGNKRGIANNGLLRWASQIPLNVPAVIMPRFGFGHNGHLSQPPGARRTQMELYTARRVRPSDGGKVLIRSLALKAGLGHLSGKHNVTFMDNTLVRYPSGLQVHALEVDKEGKYTYGINITAYNPHVHTQALRLHHYEKRSLEECMQKLDDSQNGTWNQDWGSSGWRAMHSDFCASKNEEIMDYSLYCAGKQTAEIVQQMQEKLHNPLY
jgi:hypothetical protein